MLLFHQGHYSPYHTHGLVKGDIKRGDFLMDRDKVRSGEWREEKEEREREGGGVVKIVFCRRSAPRGRRQIRLASKTTYGLFRKRKERKILA